MPAASRSRRPARRLAAAGTAAACVAARAGCASAAAPAACRARRARLQADAARRARPAQPPRASTSTATGCSTPGPRRRLPRRQPLRDRVRLRPGPGHLRRPGDRRLGARDRALARQRRPGPAERELLARPPRRPRLLFAGRVRRAIVAYARLLECARVLPDALGHAGRAPGRHLATYQSGAPDRDHSPAVWRSLARTFRHDHDVVLAPWGETVVDADCFLRGGVCEAMFGPRNRPYATAGMQQAVDVMRRAGYTGVIAIPGVDRANDLSGLALPTSPATRATSSSPRRMSTATTSAPRRPAWTGRSRRSPRASRHPRRDRRVRGGRGRVGVRRAPGRGDRPLGRRARRRLTTRGPGRVGHLQRARRRLRRTPHGAYGRWVEAHYSRSRVAPLRVRR